MNEHAANTSRFCCRSFFLFLYTQLFFGICGITTLLGFCHRLLSTFLHFFFFQNLGLSCSTTLIKPDKPPPVSLRRGGIEGLGGCLRRGGGSGLVLLCQPRERGADDGVDDGVVGEAHAAGRVEAVERRVEAQVLDPGGVVGGLNKSRDLRRACLASQPSSNSRRSCRRTVTCTRRRISGVQTRRAWAHPPPGRRTRSSCCTSACAYGVRYKARKEGPRTPITPTQHPHYTPLTCRR